MPLLRPKSPCPHCGESVKEPRDSNDFLCPHCHRPGPWASEEQAASWQVQEDAKARFQVR